MRWDGDRVCLITVVPMGFLLEDVAAGEVVTVVEGGGVLVGVGGEGCMLPVVVVGGVGLVGEGSGGRWALIGAAGEVGGGVPPVGSEEEGERGRESVGPWLLPPRRLGLTGAVEVTSGEGEWPPLGVAGEIVDSRVTMGTDDELHLEGACSDVPSPIPVTSVVSMASNIGLRSNEPVAVSMRTTSSSTSSVSMATISMATVSIAAASMVTGIPTATPPLPLSTGTAKRVCHWKRFLPLSTVVLV